jgi:predicted transcriptional regulator of viral defense system
VAHSTTAHDTIRAAARADDRLLTADDLGVSDAAMARMTDAGILERIVPGVYIGARAPRHPLIEAAAWSRRYPTAVVCLLTAAAHLALTDAFTRGTWLYVPKGTSVPRSRNLPLYIVQATPRLIERPRDEANGIVTLRVHGIALRLTGPDRTVLDLWRFPQRVSSEHALEALRRRTRAKDFELPRFARLARRVRVWGRVEPIIQGMMAR